MASQIENWTSRFSSWLIYTLYVNGTNIVNVILTCLNWFGFNGHEDLHYYGIYSVPTPLKQREPHFFFLNSWQKLMEQNKQKQ